MSRDSAICSDSEDCQTFVLQQSGTKLQKTSLSIKYHSRDRGIRQPAECWLSLCDCLCSGTSFRIAAEPRLKMSIRCASDAGCSVKKQSYFGHLWDFVSRSSNLLAGGSHTRTDRVQAGTVPVLLCQLLQGVCELLLLLPKMAEAFSEFIG